MTTYRVSWCIDVDADSPVDAARQALAIQRDNDPANLATEFKVSWREPGHAFRSRRTVAAINTPKPARWDRMIAPRPGFTQLFPCKIITAVSYGTSDNGFPMVLIATSAGDIVTLEAQGHDVDEAFTLTDLSQQ